MTIAKGSRRNKFTVLGVEAPVWQGAKTQEEEADRSAADTLIPPEENKLFVQNNCFHLGELQCFAERIGVSAGIVVGRLQNDGLLNQSWHNGMRMRFECKLNGVPTTK